MFLWFFFNQTSGTLLYYAHGWSSPIDLDDHEQFANISVKKKLVCRECDWWIAFNNKIVRS